MQRSKKVVFVSHCLLNVNSKVIGLANYEGVYKKLVADFIENNYGIIQLPCPELQYLGLKRWSMTKEQYDFLNYREFCHKLALDIIKQMKIYQGEDYKLIGLYAIDGSPSCGYNYSCNGYSGGCFEDLDEIKEYEVMESGVFMEELLKLIKDYNIKINIYSIAEKLAEEVE